MGLKDKIWELTLEELSKYKNEQGAYFDIAYISNGFLNTGAMRIDLFHIDGIEFLDEPVWIKEIREKYNAIDIHISVTLNTSNINEIVFEKISEELEKLQYSSMENNDIVAIRFTNYGKIYKIKLSLSMPPLLSFSHTKMDELENFKVIEKSEYKIVKSKIIRWMRKESIYEYRKTSQQVSLDAVFKLLNEMN